MQLTIAKTDGNVLRMLCGFASGGPGIPAWLNGRDARFSTISNFSFDECDAFRLDGWVVAEPGQPMDIRLLAEPCDLALGIVTMRLLRRRERRLTIDFAAQKLERLLVAQRVERAGLVAIFFSSLSVSAISPPASSPASNIFTARWLIRA